MGFFEDVDFWLVFVDSNVRLFRNTKIGRLIYTPEPNRFRLYGISSNVHQRPFWESQRWKNTGIEH